MIAQRLISLVLTAAVVLAAAPNLLAVPEPAKAPKSWELDFEFHDLARISLTLPGDRQPTTYWYVLYTVTNNSGREAPFFPTFELVTSSLEVVTGGENVSPSVYDAIRARHKKQYPFFRDPTRVSGKLLQGPDNARTSAAVFHNFDPGANALTVFVAGLSGEIAKVANPVYDSENPETPLNRPFFALRKTLAIQYDVPGDLRTRRMAAAVRRSQSWVMR